MVAYRLVSRFALPVIMYKYFILGLLLLVGSSCALYDSNDAVVDLTPSNFDRNVLHGDSIWLVEFYAPWCGHCKSLVPEFKKAAKALKGIVKVGAVNADEHKDLGKQYQVSGFPTIKIFTDGKPIAYKGKRSADDLVDECFRVAKEKAYRNLGRSSGGSGKSDVVELTDDNFKKLVLDSEDLWLVEFFAPWCGHCKNLEPHWAKAATELKGKVKLGALDATVHQEMAQRYQVQGYPTIKMFPAGSKSPSSAEDYNGGRTSSDIVNFALEKLAESVPAPDVVQVTGEDSMSGCSDKSLCVVSVLPHILDCNAACRNDYLAILRRLGDKYKNKMWGWVWSEAGAQPSLESALELGGFGYPAMAVVNAKKLKFSTLRGSFSEQGINEFLRDLSFGRGQTAPVRGAEMPKIETSEPWDGKDGELPAEEEIDLSDVDLEKDEL